MVTHPGKVLMIKPDYAFYSIGMAYVAAGMERAGLEYDWFDAYLEPWEELEDKLRRNDYLAVATGGLIGSFTFFRKLFGELKASHPKLPCILGGNITHALKPQQLFDFFPIDYLVLGEGELTLPALIQALQSGNTAPSGVEGIAFRNPEHPTDLVRTKPRPRIDLHKDNWIPKWDARAMQLYGVKAFPILTGRGCTGRCTFCAPTNGRFRGRPVDHIMEEIAFLNSHFQCDGFNFLNEILFDDPADIEVFCQEYEKLKLGKHWNCLLRVDLDPRIIRRMKEAGLWAVNVGLESGSDRVLKRIRKDTTVDQIRAFIAALKANGIYLDASFMFGNLDERPEDMLATVRLMKELEVIGPVALTINYPGTYNYRVAKERGLIHDEVAYIQSLDRLYGVDPFDILSRHQAGELRYLNLSSMPDSDFFPQVERCLREYHTDHFALRNTRSAPCEPEGMLELAGDCPFCGTTRQGRFDTRLFALTRLRIQDCERCGAHEIYFSPKDLPVFQEHFQALQARIASARRIALLGGPSEIRWVLRHDHFGLTPDKQVSVIQHARTWDSFAATHPIKPWEELLEEGIDLVLTLNSVPPDLLQGDFLSRVGWERIAFLTPSAFATAMADHPEPSTARERAMGLAHLESMISYEPRDLRGRIRKLVQEWKGRNARVLVHGAGAHTDGLFEWTELKQANLVGISDRNPLLRGQHRHGFEVLGLHEIRSAGPDVILLSSFTLQEEMRRDLLALGLEGVELVGC